MTRTKLPFFYGWVILAISFVIMTLAYIVRYSFPVFYVAILEEFGWSRADTAGMFSINLLIYGMFSPVAGALADRFSPKTILSIGCISLALGTALCSQATTLWHFYLVYGVVLAIATSITGMPINIVVLSNWFIRRRGAVFGIFLAGAGFSSLLVPLVQYSISTFGWRSTFLILAIFPPAILLPLIIVFHHPRPQDIGLEPDGVISTPEDQTRSSRPRRKLLVVDQQWAGIQWKLSKAMKVWRFWTLFLTSFCVFGIGMSFMMAHQAAFLVDVGYTGMFAASIILVWGVAGVIGRLGASLGDIIGREKNFTLGCSAMVLGELLLLLIKFPSHFLMPLLYAILFGFGIGMSAPTFFAAVADMFHGEHFGSINGFLVLGFGTGGVVGPWLGGYIFDVTHSYKLAFLMVILGVLVGCILLWIVSPRKIRKLVAAN